MIGFLNSVAAVILHRARRKEKNARFIGIVMIFATCVTISARYQFIVKKDTDILTTLPSVSWIFALISSI